MSLKITIPIHILKYSHEQLQRWNDGERAGCKDSYCLRLRGSYGFGEYLVGSHFNSLGYEWIHHDFDVFGGNNLVNTPCLKKFCLIVWEKKSLIGFEQFIKPSQILNIPIY